MRQLPALALVLLAACGVPTLAPIEPTVQEPRSTLAFIRAVTLSPEGGTMSYQEAEWLTGEEAVDAALADGLCVGVPREHCLPNGFYVRIGDGPSLERPIAAGAELAVLDDPGTHRTVTIREFAAYFASDVPEEDRWRAATPYHVTLDTAGTVILVEEQYIP